jgi:capsular exopolysaccharide synthesis family protein
MSKIFDAFQGARSEVSDLLPALVDEVDFPAVEMPESFAAPAGAPRVDIAPPQASPLRRVKLAIPDSAPVLPYEGQSEEAAEQYRIARTKIIHHPKKPRLIAITSPSTGDGKTVTAINIAGALSLKAAAKVLLVDVDFRRSAVHALLALPRSPGLAEVIAGECSFEDAAVETEEYPNLNILTGGEANVNPSELLEAPRWHAFCAMARERYEYVILDTPPLGVVTDSDLVQMAADGVLLVLRMDYTSRSSCAKAFETIPKEKLLGVLLNCTKAWPLDRHGYGYGQGYGYGGPRLAGGELARRPQAARP